VLDHRSAAADDAAMLAVRRCGVVRPRCAWLVVAMLSGCRGDPPRPAPPATDETLAWPAVDEAGLATLVMTGGFEHGAPVPLAITPDGAVLFRRSKPRDPAADLYQLDAAGKTTVLATAAALLGGAPGGEPAGPPAASAGIERVEVSRDGARLLIPLAGRAFVVERATGSARELAIGAHRDPRLSPDGKRVAFVRDGDLWVAPVGEPGAPARIAQHPPGREYATPEATAHDFDRHDGFWWSPDGQSIAFQRSDARAVDTLHLGDPRQPEQPASPVRFPRAGRPTAIVDLGIVAVRGGAPRWVIWDAARYPYLARVIWPARGPLTLIVVSREQTQLAVLAVDAQTGRTRPLLEDKADTWLSVVPEALTWLDDGSGFLWMTESPGAWSLEHRAADGALVRPILTADAGLRRVVAISPDRRDVIVEGAADPREHHVWRVPLAGGPPAALTSSGGVHRAIAGHGVVVIGSALRAGGRAATAIRADGSRVELPSVAERPAAAPTTTIRTAGVEYHAQYTAITRPRGADGKVRYPVLLHIDSGPGKKGVLDALDSYAMDQWFADAGFIVVRTDGRGVPGHDRAWERSIAGDVLTIPMNDQIGALKRIGPGYPELDLGRAGVIGTGVGGYLAVLGVLTHPEVFSAAVAVSPITSWELLSAAFAERYMKSPAANAAGYRRTSAATYAEQLKRPLLIMHGLADRRIHVAHALQLIDALSAAGKRVELATLPDPRDATRTISSVKLQLEFLREHLGPPVRPAVMPAPLSGKEREKQEQRERARVRGEGSGAGIDDGRGAGRR
jgi:dipeptidyl-peptidase-4